MHIFSAVDIHIIAIMIWLEKVNKISPTDLVFQSDFYRVMLINSLKIIKGKSKHQGINLNEYFTIFKKNWNLFRLKKMLEKAKPNRQMENIISNIMGWPFSSNLRLLERYKVYPLWLTIFQCLYNLVLIMSEV